VGNFIAFISNAASKELVETSGEAFRAASSFPIEVAVLPESIPGVGFSDHWSFWQEGYPAFMITDTAPYRYSHYHKPTDTPDKLDFDRFFEVVKGVAVVVGKLANP
jgi:hypothetical protein